MDLSFLTFLGVSALVIMTPGPDTALTIRNTLLGGRSGGILTAVGVSTGQLIWATATSMGIIAVLLASKAVFDAIQLAGAVYLVALGVFTLLAALRSRGPDAPSTKGTVRVSLRPLTAFRQGLINNLGNPKMAVFFASILPQFAPQNQGMFSTLVALGMIFAGLTLLWLVLYATVVSAVGVLLRRSNVRRIVEAIAGAVLIGLGVRLATEAR